MTSLPLRDAPADVTAGGRRGDVLSLLRTTEQPLSAADVAAATGLHLNTARFHLDALVEDSLAERTSEPRDTPGRPRVLYSAHGPVPGPRSYALLAEMLTGLVASLDDAGPAAIGAGKAWGRHLVERAAPSERVDADEAVARLNRVLDAVGFQPETRAPHPVSVTKSARRKEKREPAQAAQAAQTAQTEQSAPTEIHLHHCPFREVAEKHTDVVCAIHLGLMQGALEELRAPVDATSLEPFVTPQLCIARLRART